MGAQVQDEAAGLVVAALDPLPGERVLDCCAAPGGKALFAAARMQGQVGSARPLLQGLVGAQAQAFSFSLFSFL